MSSTQTVNAYASTTTAAQDNEAVAVKVAAGTQPALPARRAAQFLNGAVCEFALTRTLHVAFLAGQWDTGTGHRVAP